jgi:hypothetical protein
MASLLTLIVILLACFDVTLSEVGQVCFLNLKKYAVVVESGASVMKLLLVGKKLNELMFPHFFGTTALKSILALSLNNSTEHSLSPWCLKQLISEMVSSSTRPLTPKKSILIANT